jgi:hypothetical protein
MKLDIELLAEIMDSMSKDGPPENCNPTMRDIIEAAQDHFLVWESVRHSVEVGNAQLNAHIAASFKFGFEAGLQYAELTKINKGE